MVFYQAMVIFAKKHFSKKNARTFSFLINLAIYFRAFLAILKRFTDRLVLPLFDAVIIYTGIYFIQNYWAQSVVFKNGGNYPLEFLMIAVPVYIIIWLFSAHLSGGYDRPINLYRIFRGIFAGTVVILVFYSLLDESLRFSRALILLGALWGYISMTGIRLILNLAGLKSFQIGDVQNKRYVVVGDKEETERVAKILTTIEIQPSFIGIVSCENTPDYSGNFIGTLDQIGDIVDIYKINEIIFCAKNVPARTIIDRMTELKNRQVDYKIAPPESLSIIGSNSINTAGDLYTLEINSISKMKNRRNKRFLDIAISIALLFGLPIIVFLVKKPVSFIKNLVLVILSIKTWVGYCKTESHDSEKLPPIKPGVLNPAMSLHFKQLNQDTLERLNLLYARDYKTRNDLHIISKGFKYLGNN